jgi:hypothetical protein
MILLSPMTDCKTRQFTVKNFISLQKEEILEAHKEILSKKNSAWNKINRLISGVQKPSSAFHLH